MTVADLLSVADLAVTEQLTVSDNTTLGARVVNSKQTRVVVTDGSTVTPLGAFQPISATANTGTSSIGGCTQGRQVELINVANVTITFTDTANLRLSGNAALGQYDSLTVHCLDGTIWVEVGETNNSDDLAKAFVACGAAVIAPGAPVETAVIEPPERAVRPRPQRKQAK
jgi:hypothetical protein